MKISKLLENRFRQFELTHSITNINIGNYFAPLNINYNTFVPYKLNKHSLFIGTWIELSVFPINRKSLLKKRLLYCDIK
uniref:Uncharacterized protein n=1 Tax=Physcomitrium patens TaxID=3218 RepID=A0A2K1KND8_PHYPA|nr:hypothetical protein PHYPA_006173 [Physcomitrium patens]